MKKGPVVTAVVSVVAFGVVIAAFAKNASPYVTVREARSMSGDHLHIAGDVVPETLHMNLQHHTLEFDMKDQDGTQVHVVHSGEPPANLSEVKKVVAIGSMKGSEFESDQLLVKCPSKYEASNTVAQK